MFSELGPLFKTTFRQAESNDTRQKIPHDERDQQRHKHKDERATKEQGDLWEDNTTVSLEALRNFLINFMRNLAKEQGLEVPETEAPDMVVNQRPKEKNRPTNTKNAKAVRAYQSIAAQSEKANPAKHNLAEKNRPAFVNQIENQELRDIYQLIDDLDQLSQKNVQTITIQKNGSFIESLKISVKSLL